MGPVLMTAYASAAFQLSRIQITVLVLGYGQSRKEGRQEQVSVPAGLYT